MKLNVVFNRTHAATPHHHSPTDEGEGIMEQQPVFKGFDEEGFAVFELPFDL